MSGSFILVARSFPLAAFALRLGDVWLMKNGVQRITQRYAHLQQCDTLGLESLGASVQKACQWWRT